MARRKRVVLAETKFDRDYEYKFPNFNDTLKPGDLFKVRGEYGVKFKFACVVTNKETGAQWIDCFEVNRGTKGLQAGVQRSFKFDRIKRIPRKRVNKKYVS